MVGLTFLGDEGSLVFVLYFLLFWLSCCWYDFLIDFGLFCFVDLGIENQSKIEKINLKFYQKSAAIWNGFWIATGLLLDPIWSQVGANLAPTKKNKKIDPNGHR